MLADLSNIVLDLFRAPHPVGDDLWLRVVTTIPAALLATITALTATWATHAFAARRSRANVRAGLRVEITSLKDELVRLSELKTGTTHIEAKLLEKGKDVCPVFFSNTASFSMLSLGEAKSIYEFYVHLLTVPPFAGNQGAIVFYRSDIVTLSNKAEAALAALGGH